MSTDAVVKKLKSPALAPFLGITKLVFAAMTLAELFYFSAFLTDSALISTAVTAIILSATSALDLVSSFLLGVFIEKVKMPWGKYRSWLLVAPVAVIITFTLMFVRISENEIISAIFIIAMFVISHLVWSVGEACLNSMPLVMTDDLSERANLSVWLGRGSMGNALLFGIIVGPILNFSAKTFGAKYQFAGLAFVCALIYLVVFWLFFFATKGMEDTGQTKEDDSKKKKEDVNLKVAVKASFTNKNLIIMMLGVAITYGYMILQSGALYYYFTYTLGGGAIMGMMGTVISAISIARLVGSFVVPFLLKVMKGSKKHVFCLGFICLAAFFIVPYFINFAPTVKIIIITIGNIFGALPLAMWIGLYQDCAVECEYRSGQDIKGFVMSLSVMPVKIGIVLKSVITGLFLVAIDYSATATGAAAAAYPQAFNSLYLLIPAIMCIAIAVIVMLFYNLKESDVEEMQKQIAEKSQA